MTYDDFLASISDIATKTIGSFGMIVRAGLAITNIAKKLKETKSPLEKIWGILEIIGLSLLALPGVLLNKKPIYVRTLTRALQSLRFISPKLGLLGALLSGLYKAATFNVFIPIAVGMLAIPLGLTFMGFAKALHATTLSSSKFVQSIENNKGNDLISTISKMFKFDINFYIRKALSFLRLLGFKFKQEFPLFTYFFKFVTNAVIYLKNKISALSAKIKSQFSEINLSSISGIVSNIGISIFKTIFSFLFKGIIGKILATIIVFLALTSKKFKTFIMRFPILRAIYTSLRSVGLRMIKLLKLDLLYQKMREFTQLLIAGRALTNSEGVSTT